MNNQPSLRGIKNVQKPPTSVYAKPLNGNTTRSKELTESQPPLIETNNVEPKHLPVPEIIPLPQHHPKSNVKTSAINQAMQNTTLRRQYNNINLTNIIIKAITSPTTRSITAKRDMKLTKLNRRCQTDYEKFLSNEDKELMLILRRYDINKEVLLKIMDYYFANVNNNEPDLANNNMQIINIDGDEHNETENQIERNDDILNSVRVHSDINKMFINLMYLINVLKDKASNLTKKGQKDAHHALIKIFCDFFNAESRDDYALTVDKETQTDITDAHPVNGKKRRYQGIATKMTMDNAQCSTAATIKNIVPLKPVRPPPPLQQAEQLTQEQQWLRYYNSMNQHVLQKVQKQKSKLNLSTCNAPNGQTQYGPQQEWIYPSQSTGDCGRNGQKICRVDGSQGFSRQAGWCTNQEQTNQYAQYGYQYLQQYNTYPQCFSYSQQNQNNSG